MYFSSPHKAKELRQKTASINHHLAAVPSSLERKAQSTQPQQRPKRQVSQTQIEIPVSLRPDLRKWIASAGHHALNKQTPLADTQLPVGFWWVRLEKAAKSNDQQLLS